MGGVSAAVSKTAAAPIERVKLLIQNQVSKKLRESQQRRGRSTSVQSINVFLRDFGNFRFLYGHSNFICLTFTKVEAKVADIGKKKILPIYPIRLT